MELKNKILFIINPISGVGKKNIIPSLIEKELDLNKFEYSIKYTEYRNHGYEIAKEESNNYQAIVAVGGDGSVNEIGGALVNSNCALGIIPCGSGNGLARHLRIPLKLANAIQRINCFEIRSIDTGKVNDRIFLGTCGFGFDAHIAKKFDEFHKRGFFSYAKLVLREYKSYTSNNFEVTIRDKTFEKSAFMCSIANSAQFGNGFIISPGSDVEDGIFELIFLKEFKRRHLPMLAYRFFTGSINRASHFECLEFREEIKITVNQATPYHIDGEPCDSGTNFVIKLNKSSLKVL